MNTLLKLYDEVGICLTNLCPGADRTGEVLADGCLWTHNERTVRLEHNGTPDREPDQIHILIQNDTFCHHAALNNEMTGNAAKCLVAWLKDGKHTVGNML